VTNIINEINSQEHGKQEGRISYILSVEDGYSRRNSSLIMSGKKGLVLNRLRQLMRGSGGNGAVLTEAIHALIIPSGDAHQSEYIADCDCRRAYVSGFTGSAGTAIVTEKDAALWTDGRYFLSASQQLDPDSWTLMKDGLPDTPSQADWLCKVLPAEGGKVGVDPFLLQVDVWKPLSLQLESSGHSLIATPRNLVDVAWGPDRPDPPANPVFPLPLQYTGKPWQEKIDTVRAKMKEKSCQLLVVTNLDEIAWLLNLRGSDITYNPVFFSYVVLTLDEIHFFIDEHRLENHVKEHLNISNDLPAVECRDDSKTDGASYSISIHPYSELMAFLTDVASDEKNLVKGGKLAGGKDGGKAWVSDRSSRAIASVFKDHQRVTGLTPIAALKAVKNPVEIEGMRQCHIRDGAAVCEYLAWLQNQLKRGHRVTEISGADYLERCRAAQEDFVSLSFDSISSVGSNAAIIHYRPQPDTDRQVTNDQIYLLDSGAQYKDGTTDVTRTYHFGIPSDFERSSFTRVLKGHIELASAVFPNGVKGHMIDCLARMHLWTAGLDYLHGTGHGVGSFLNVHEGPCGISPRVSAVEIALEEGMILSDEPGYYHDGSFGIRIESLVAVTKAKTENNFKEKGFLTFDPITMVPLCQNLMDASLLTAKEVEWIDSYHTRVRDLVGPYLKAKGKAETYNWLLEETKLMA